MVHNGILKTKPFSTMECDIRISISIHDFLFLLCFDPIQVYGLPLWGFAVTLVGHIALGRIPLDE
jgi:hypothetical protein